ncbi:UbiD family decarboxylase [Methanospirillum stamsii]|uniref:Anhydromevalonate phosphate decarboxylase n=1 Tax=Methanospirillum stamsii TaxID=1277351 RepID=A0A2V2N765_9EURY|nr:UbiD family decarboxylase [Methanospirillum stamsii]PWR71113.1 UbiD family decarboxylase [Methanospirillum stamsii]
MRTFIEQMRARGLVTDIHEPVSSRFEAPKIAFNTDKLVFFHNLDGKKAVMNLVASREAISVALDVTPDSLVPTLAKCRYDGKVKDAGTLPLRPVNLDEIPIMENYPGEAGRYLNSGVVFSRYDGVENASVHRMLKCGKDRLVARLVEGRHTHTLHKRALANGERLPVAVVIGMHPLVLFASCSRVPENMELLYAAELLGGEIPVYTLPNGVRVPEAEIILEGYIGTETSVEGPYVDITRTYDPERIQPVIELTGMYTKPDFIYHGLVNAGDEHKVLMGSPYEPLIYRSVAGVTGVTDVVLTKGGCGYLHGVVQIKKRTEGDGKNAIMAAFAAHTSLKHVVIVDTDINPANPSDVEFAIATRVRADRDTLIIPGVRGSSLDPSRIGDGLNVKMGIDATMELGKETEFVRAVWEDC